MSVLPLIIIFQIDFDCIVLLHRKLVPLICYKTCSFEMKIVNFSFFRFFFFFYVRLIKKIFSLILKLECGISSLLNVKLFFKSYFLKRCLMKMLWSSSLNFGKFFQILLSKFQLYTAFLIRDICFLIKIFICSSCFFIK